MAGAAGAGVALGSGGLAAVGSESAEAAPTVLDDFEDGDLSEYAGTTGEFAVEQSSAMEGSYRLKAIDSYGKIGHSTTSSRGYEYKCRLQAGSGSSSKPGLLVSAQDQSRPLDDCYWLSLNVPGDKIALIRRDSASNTRLDDASVSLSEGTEYRGAKELASDTVKAVLYDSSGSKLAETTAVSDSTFSGGYFGFYNGGSPGYPCYFDYVTQDSLGSDGSSDGSTLVIDDFEDGDIAEYSFDRGSAGASVVSSPTYAGSYALEITDDNTELISTSGLPNYPVAGDTFSTWVRGTNGADDLDVTYGVQDHDNRYFVNVEIQNGAIRLSKLENDSSTVLDADSGFSLAEDAWYELEVDWGRDGTHTVRIYNSDGSKLGQCSATDKLWTCGGFGYDAFLDSSGGTAYFDRTTVSETQTLGSFESTFDDWDADSGSTLSRVDTDQEPACITHGGNALKATIDGDPEQIIYTTRVQSADLSNHPCLLADVLPASVENTDSPVTFRFRYHHTNPGGVEESHEMTVAQKHGGRICWDMSGLSSTKLANPNRLDIAWYPEDHPPSSDFHYHGVTYVDNVQLADDRNQITNARCVLKQRDLERAHGLRIDQVVRSETATTQDGVYKYSDGTEVAYQIEKLQNGDVEETCDGETFHWEVSS
jgi:hypothetical protein